jgi:hypothetical protein
VSDEGPQGTKWLVPFAFIVTLIVPFTAPLWAYGLWREGRSELAVAVLALGVVWAVVLFGTLL